MISPGSTLFQMWDDPDEGRLLQALSSRPDDDALLLDYANHLESQNDPRGEFLRLEYLLSAAGRLGEITAVCQARYQELLQRRPHGRVRFSWLVS